MAQWEKGFPNKKIFKIKERAKRIFSKFLKKNKAFQKREFRKNFQIALDQIQKYNRTEDLREKALYISSAVEVLEFLLGERPGNHKIRLQYELCRDEFQIQSQIETSDRTRKIRLILEGDYLS